MRISKIFFGAFFFAFPLKTLNILEFIVSKARARSFPARRSTPAALYSPRDERQQKVREEREIRRVHLEKKSWAWRRSAG